MGQFKIGDKVAWIWSAYNGKMHGVVIGTIVEINPSVSPNSKYGVQLSNGQRTYPSSSLKIHKIDRVTM